MLIDSGENKTTLCRMLKELIGEIRIWRCHNEISNA
jgi:hypothetical protein